MSSVRRVFGGGGSSRMLSEFPLTKDLKVCQACVFFRHVGLFYKGNQKDNVHIFFEAVPEEMTNPKKCSFQAASKLLPESLRSWEQSRAAWGARFGSATSGLIWLWVKTKQIPFWGRCTAHFSLF